MSRPKQGRGRVRLEDPILEQEQEQQSLLAEESGQPRPIIVPASAVGHAGASRQAPPPLHRSTSTPYSRYAAENDALEEMEKVFSDTEKEQFKTLVKADQPEPKLPKRYSENDFQGHFKEDQFARPHDVLKHGRKKKKSYSGPSDGKDGASAPDTADAPEDAPDGDGDAPDDAPPDTPSTDEPSTPPSADQAPSAQPVPKISITTDAPVLDQRAAYVPDSDDGDVANRVKFEVGPDDDGEEDSRPTSAQNSHRHHHRHHRGSHAEPTTGGASSGQAADGGQRMADINTSTPGHRYEGKSGHRRHKVTRKKDDKTISNVVHLGDVNTGQTMLLGKKTYDHTPHDMFVEMDELMVTDKDVEWQETARWIKYEEDVEQGSNRWGRPHLAALSFLSLMNLRRCLERGVLLLDVEEHDSVAISHRIATQLVTEDQIQQQDFGAVMRTLLLRRQHVGDHQGGKGLRHPFHTRNLSKLTMQSMENMRNNSHRSLSDMEKKEREPSMVGSLQVGNLSRQNSVGGESMTAEQELHRFLAHQSILRRMAPGTEVFSVNVGKVDWATKPVCAFVRLAEGTFLPGITEMPLPVRFIFFLVGPQDSDEDLHETGRAFATLMSSPTFHDAAYKAESRSDLMWAFKEFLDDTLVLPPIDWTANPDVLDVRELQQRSRDIQDKKRLKLDLEERLSEAPGSVVSGGVHRHSSVPGGDPGGDPLLPADDPLVRHGRPFAGFIRDVKRRYPWYLSDYKDGLNGAVISSAFFIFFAALAGAITFGGLMMDKTKLQIGISETIISTSMAGIVFSLFACQPLIIIGTTGPVLLFDEALFSFAKSNGLEFLPMRVWIAIWMLVISLIVVALEGSVLVRKFTRFTTEIFSSLISLLFIYESLSKLAAVFKFHPLIANYCDEPQFFDSLHMIAAELGLMMPTDNTTELPPVTMAPDNATFDATFNATDNATDLLLGNLTKPLGNAPLLEPKFQPNTALFSMMLMFGTFAIANYLRHFRNSKFLGRRVRRMLGDFGVPIAILLMVAVDVIVPQVYTQHLQVPPGLTPSNPALRGWIISPLGLTKNIHWMAIVGAIPAAGLIFIVIYMETMVCELIMAKPERNLQKGTGFHFDIVLISVLNLVSTLIGAPWMCAATIRSVSHAAALTMMSTNYAPGEKPAVVGVHEQRLSNLLVSIMMGLSVALSSVLKLIPVAVVFGVFIYMGVSSMTGVQMMERAVLFLKPVKYHDKANYVKRVRTWRMHLFTVIQLSCLGFLLGIKFTPAAIGFPFFLAMLIPLRLVVLPKIFTEVELNALDGDGGKNDDEEDADFYEEAHTMPSHTSTANLFANSSLQLLRVHSTLAGNALGGGARV